MRIVLLTLFFLLLVADATAETLEGAIKRFVQRETQGVPGRISVTVGALSAGTRIGECANPEVFVPSGSRLWGTLNIGVRCAEPSQWTVYVPVEVRVHGRYLVARRKLVAGTLVSEQDISDREGELTSLPANVLTETGQAVGKYVRVGVGADTPLRAEHLVQLPVIRQGQAVRVVIRGAGFSVSSDGKALANAHEGESLRVKTAAGHTVTGTARSNGVVEVQN
jgi:flagellar basal body P-ring formation protein FlgA